MLLEEDCFSEAYQAALRSLITSAVHQDYCDDYTVDFMDDAKKSTLLKQTFQTDYLCAAAVLGVRHRFGETIENASGSSEQTYHDRGVAVLARGRLFTPR